MGQTSRQAQPLESCWLPRSHGAGRPRLAPPPAGHPGSAAERRQTACWTAMRPGQVGVRCTRPRGLRLALQLASSTNPVSHPRGATSCLQHAQVQVAQHAAPDSGRVRPQHHLVRSVLRSAKGHTTRCDRRAGGRFGTARTCVCARLATARKKRLAASGTQRLHARTCMLKCSFKWLSMLPLSSCSACVEAADHARAHLVCTTMHRRMAMQRARPATCTMAPAAQPCLRQRVCFGVGLQVPHLLAVLADPLVSLDDQQSDTTDDVCEEARDAGAESGSAAKAAGAPGAAAVAAGAEAQPALGV